MQANELQLQFFNHLKSILPSHISMVDELTDLLDLSYDSVYRRIRGEKPIDLNELRSANIIIFHLTRFSNYKMMQ